VADEVQPNAVQAFTLWNLQPDAKISMTAELLDIATGTAETPVREAASS
jgi:hypothetical protein